MKKIIIVIMSFLLVGCQQVQSFEILENGKIILDDVEYDLSSTREILYEYDSDGNIIKRTIENNEKTRHTEFVYQNNVLVEQKDYDNNILSITHKYTYDDDKLLKEEAESPSGLKTTKEFSYDGNQQNILFRNSDGSVSFTHIGTLDDNGNVIYYETFDSNDDLLSQVHRTFKDGLLIYVKGQDVSGQSSLRVHEYNKHGDLILSYLVRYGDKNILNAVLYEHEYKNDHIIKMIEYNIHSEIDTEHIRVIEEE